MKSFVGLALVFACVLGSAVAFNVPANKKATIQQRLAEQLKKSMLPNMESLDIKPMGSILPPLRDPQHLAEINYDLSTPTLNVTFQLSGGVARGLSGVVEDTRVRQSLFSITIDSVIDVNPFSIEGPYSVSGSVGDYDTEESWPITGAGFFQAKVSRAKIIASAYIWIDIFFGQLHIEDLATDVLFEDISITAENAAIGGEVIDWAEHNKSIKLYFDMFIWSYYFKPMVEKQVYEDLRNFIRYKSLGDIVDHINRGQGIQFPSLRF